MTNTAQPREFTTRVKVVSLIIYVDSVAGLIVVIVVRADVRKVKVEGRVTRLGYLAKL
jgi:hypothetical protein